MLSVSDTVAIIAITLLVALPWLAAVVLALKDASRNPSASTYLWAAAVVLGSTPVVLVYFVYRAWRGDLKSREHRPVD